MQFPAGTMAGSEAELEIGRLQIGEWPLARVKHKDRRRLSDFKITR